MGDEATAAGESLGLTRTESAVFQFLNRRPDALVTRDELLTAMKGQARHTIDSHIMAIRQKLRSAGATDTIETVKGTGFILRRVKG